MDEMSLNFWENLNDEKRNNLMSTVVPFDDDLVPWETLAVWQSEIFQ